jgi:hypothetical protein
LSSFGTSASFLAELEAAVDDRTNIDLQASVLRIVLPDWLDIRERVLPLAMPFTAYVVPRASKVTAPAPPQARTPCLTVNGQERPKSLREMVSECASVASWLAQPAARIVKHRKGAESDPHHFHRRMGSSAAGSQPIPKVVDPWLP